MGGCVIAVGCGGAWGACAKRSRSGLRIPSAFRSPGYAPLGRLDRHRPPLGSSPRHETTELRSFSHNPCLVDGVRGPPTQEIHNSLLRERALWKTWEVRHAPQRNPSLGTLRLWTDGGSRGERFTLNNSLSTPARLFTLRGRLPHGRPVCASFQFAVSPRGLGGLHGPQVRLYPDRDFFWARVLDGRDTLSGSSSGQRTIRLQMRPGT